ncbi:unnamed protein product [Ectocarpus sp. 13 AM-2016]
MSGSTTARREVSEWLKAQTVEERDGGVVRIEIDHVKEEERRIVLKEASGGQVFSITYQKEYPNSADEYLVRGKNHTNGTRAWEPLVLG